MSPAYVGASGTNFNRPGFIPVPGLTLGSLSMIGIGVLSVTPASSPSWPNATNTGVPSGTTLTDASVVGSGTGWTWDSRGWISVIANNAILDALYVPGSLVNNGNYTGISITRCQFVAPAENSVVVQFGTGGGHTMSDTEICGSIDGSIYTRGIAFAAGASGNVFSRLNCHHCIHSGRIDGGTTLQDSWLHNLPMGDTGFTTDHTDGVMQTAGASPTIIRRNHIDAGNNAGYFIQWSTGNPNVGSVLIDSNYFACIIRNGQTSSAAISIAASGLTGPVTISNNTLERGWGVGDPYILPGSGVSLSGNTYTDGTAINS